MPDAAFELQKAVYTKLTESQSLRDLMGGEVRLYDDVPPDTPYPYIVYEDIEADEWQTDLDDGTQHIIRFHVWSNRRGRKTASLIATKIRSLLNRQEDTIIVDGHHLIIFQFENHLSEQHAQDFRVLVEFEAFTEPVI